MEDIYLFMARQAAGPPALTVTAGGRRCLGGRWGGDYSFDDYAPFLVQISACDVGSRRKKAHSFPAKFEKSISFFFLPPNTKI